MFQAAGLVVILDSPVQPQQSQKSSLSISSSTPLSSPFDITPPRVLLVQYATGKCGIPFGRYYPEQTKTPLDTCMNAFERSTGFTIKDFRSKLEKSYMLVFEWSGKLSVAYVLRIPSSDLSSLYPIGNPNPYVKDAIGTIFPPIYTFNHIHKLWQPLPMLFRVRRPETLFWALFEEKLITESVCDLSNTPLFLYHKPSSSIEELHSMAAHFIAKRQMLQYSNNIIINEITMGNTQFLFHPKQMTAELQQEQQLKEEQLKEQQLKEEQQSREEQ